MPVKTVSSQSKSCDKCKGEWIGNDALVTQHAPRRVCQPLVITSRWKPLPESTTSTLLWEEAFISKSLHNTTLNLFCNAVRCCSGFRLDVAGLPMKLLKKCSHTYTMTDMEKEHIVARWCAKSLHITHCYVWSMNPLPDYDPSNTNIHQHVFAVLYTVPLYIVFVSFDGASAEHGRLFCSIWLLWLSATSQRMFQGTPQMNCCSAKHCKCNWCCIQLV